MGRAPKAKTRGYALLLLIFFVTVLMISVGVAVPNVIIQGRREKEKEMIWRGKQYVRGIRLYYQKNGHFPTQLEDLYKPRTGLRFMRQPYKDPVNTADGSWRLISVAPNGQLIGSLKERHNMYFFGAVPTNPGSVLAPPATSSASNKSSFSFSSQFQSSSQPSSGFGSFSSGSSPNLQNSALSDPTTMASKDVGGNSHSNASNQLGAANSQDGGIGSAKGNVAGSDSVPQVPAPSDNQSAEGLPAGNSAADQNGQSSDAGPASAASPTSASSSQTSTPVAGASQTSNPQTSSAQQPDSGPTFGKTIIIGVGSKINKASVMRYDKEKNYLHFEFVWDGLTGTSGAPAP